MNTLPPEECAQYLNLGCGKRYSRDAIWMNVDMAPQGEGVLRMDLLHGIPFPDQRFSLVYHSHLLEHLTPVDAVTFIRECHRVIKPGGVIRIAVPDLERLARDYIKALEAAVENPASAPIAYDWSILALFDQTVREKSGGAMADYLAAATPEQTAYASEMIGSEADEIIRSVRRAREEEALRKDVTPKRESWLRLLFRRGGRRDALCKLLLGQEFELLQAGRFRASGEIHKWMYDRFSLSRLLTAGGFSEFSVCNAGESRIPKWSDYHIEINEEGRIHKPDSLFVEARKAAV